MKKIIFFSLIAAVVLIAGCAPKAVPNKDQALVDSLLKVNENVFNSGDAKIIADIYADDVLWIANGKNTWTRDSIYAVMKTMAPYIKNFKGYLGPTSVSTDMIQMQKYYTCDWVAGGSILKVKGVAILIWQKQADNSWKIVLEKADRAIKTY